MNWLWFGVGALFALINFIALWGGNRTLEGVAKPATMVFLIVGLAVNGLGNVGETRMLALFLVGAILCLIGDVFLWLPPERFFRSGLIAFLFGHVAYILGFGWISQPDKQLFPIIVFILILVIVGFRVATKIVRGLRISNRDQLVVPIVVYSIVISVMLFQAGSRLLDDNWSVVSGLLVAFGALSFFISDVLNAWTRFVEKLQNDRIIVMSTYHFGQFAIIVGVLTHLSG